MAKSYEARQQERGMRVLQAVDIADNPQQLPWIILYRQKVQKKKFAQ
jgi:hypothetical protein